MLFFFYNSFPNKPIGVNCDRINLVVSFTQAFFYNQLDIVN